MRINKQLIILVYNDVKNLKWILSCCKGVHSVTSMKDPKRLSLRDNHIWFIFLQLQQMLSADKQASYSPSLQRIESLRFDL